MEDAAKPYALSRLIVSCVIVGAVVAMAVWYVVNWLLDQYGTLLDP